MVFITSLYLFLSLVCAADNAQRSGYDIIIVGGGTAGCVLANRLSADPSISVAVIEAGPTVFNDSRVLAVSPAGPAWNTELDWNYTTTPQVYANNAILQYHAGRDMGGTSTINGLLYLRPTAEELDMWAALGNTGINWDGLLPYFMKSERLQKPDLSQTIAGAYYDPDVHGSIGPLKVGWSKDLAKTAFSEAINSTWQGLGLSWNAEPNDGDPTGLSYYPTERDIALNIREDAARAYYVPIIDRQNLHVFTNTTALNIESSDSTSGNGYESCITAEGVRVLLPSGETQTLTANKEVILSTGTYRTPGLLEVSGIGNPTILRNLSITPKIDLPGVGAHLQDQWLTSMIYSANATIDNLVREYNESPLYATVTAADLFGADLDNVAAQVRRDIPSYARLLSQASGGAISVQAQERILHLRADLIFEKGVAIGQILIQSFGATAWGTLPFSTGSVHSSSDPSSPLLNPNFLQLSWDAQVHERISNLIRTIYSSPAIQSALDPSGRIELLPGLSAVPVNASLAQWTSWNKQALGSAWHGVGTAGMRRRDWGGVVDTKFRVYGTEGLRVVDASVIPMEVNGNPTSTIYALAEMAADDILADIGKVK